MMKPAAFEIMRPDSIHWPQGPKDCFPGQGAGMGRNREIAVGKKDLMKWIKKILDPEKNLDLEFLGRLEIKELETLLAALRVRMER